MVFREMFLNSQRQGEQEWVVDSEGNVFGGDSFNAGFVKKKAEQIRALLGHNGLESVEMHIFSNGYGMQRAAIHISAIHKEYDFKDLTAMLSAYTGLRIGLVRVKFCNQCGTQMLALANGNKCPTCTANEQEMRRLVEPLDKPVWKERFDRARLSSPNDGVYNDGARVKELLQDDDLGTADAQPDTETATRELLDGDSLEVSRNDYGERHEAEIAPLERLLPHSPSWKRVEARKTTPLATEKTQGQEVLNEKREKRPISEPNSSTVAVAKPEVFREPEQEGKYAPQKAPVKTVENEAPQSPRTESKLQELQTTQEEDWDLEEETEDGWPSWMAMQKNGVQEDESVSKPVEGYGIVEGARVEIVKGPFRETFEELGTAIIRLVNKKKRVATVEMGQMRISIPLDQLRPL